MMAPEFCGMRRMFSARAKPSMPGIITSSRISGNGLALRGGLLQELQGLERRFRRRSA